MGDWGAAAKTRASGGGEDVGMDEWQRDEGGVTRGKLHCSLCFTSLHSPPSAPKYSSSNYLKETSSLLLTLSLALGCPTGKFCLSDQTDNRSAQHRDTLPLTLFFFENVFFFFWNHYKRNDTDDKRKRRCEKENIVEGRHFIRCKHDWAQDKEILFWRYAGFRQLGFTLSTAGIHFIPVRI